MANPKTWIVVADSSRARIFEALPREQRLQELQVLTNPKGRAEDRELITDAHPRFSGHGGVGRPGSRSTSGPASDRQEMSAGEHENELFAREIARALDKARVLHRFDRLYIVAPPKFLGLLRGKLDREVEKLVADEADKDLAWFNARELETYLRPPREGFSPGSAQAR